MDAFTNSGILLVNAIGFLYLLAVLLRFLLQVAKADFYNPVSQAVFRITNPVIRVLRTFIPGYKGLDFSTLLLALVVQIILIYVLITLHGFAMPPVGTIITWAVAGVILFIVNIYFYAILGSIIMSFVMLFSGSTNPHPILNLIWQLTEPIMSPIRRILPPMGGMDFSPILIFILIRLIQNLLTSTFGITPGVAQVIIGV